MEEPEVTVAEVESIQITKSARMVAMRVREAMARQDVTPEGIGLDPELAACIESGDPPTLWQTGLTALQTRERYFQLLTDMADHA